MKNKKTSARIKTSDHGFDLWFMEELLYEAVRTDNVKGYNNVVDNNQELADEYFQRCMEKIEKEEIE